MADSIFELNLMDNPLLPFRIRYCSTKRRSSIPNWHVNIEILLCALGSGYFLCGENKYPVTPGDFVVANSEILHDVTTDEYIEFYCLNIDSHFCLENGIPSASLTFRELIQDQKLNQVFLQIFEAQDRYRQTDDYFEIAAIRAAVLEFLYLLCKEHTLPQAQTATHYRGELVKTAVIYIRKHLSEPLTLDTIADHAGVTKNHLARLFKQVLGKTVFETVRVLRCNEAKHRIERGMSVSQAAYSCGFENLSYFTKVFKKHYNMLPSHCCRENPSRPGSASSVCSAPNHQYNAERR